MNANTKIFGEISAYENQQSIHDQVVFTPGRQRWFDFNIHSAEVGKLCLQTISDSLPIWGQQVNYEWILSF